MDEKTILSLYRSVQNNADFESNPLNKREINSIMQKNKRRSKKDNTGRNYLCGCGKNYLSYPALYTHIKNKHEGKTPEGSTLQPQNRVKPGRPPRRADSPSKKSDMGDEDDTENDEDDSQSARASDRLSRGPGMDLTPTKTRDDRGKMFNFRKEMLSLEDLVLVRKLDCHGSASPTKNFVKERNLITNQFILHPVVDIINNLRNDTLPDQFFSTLTCDKLFGVYLYNLSKYCNQTYHSMASQILRCFRECLNDHGYDLLQLFEAQNPTQKIELLKEGSSGPDSPSFCKVEPAWYISIVYDYFAKEYYPVYLGGSPFNLAFVCAFLQEFNDWLLKNNLSKIKTSFFSYYN